VLMSAGAENLQTVFLFSDSQVHTHTFSAILSHSQPIIAGSYRQAFMA
jgi:hypothetical protein